MSVLEFNPEWVKYAREGEQSALTLLYKYSYKNVYLTIKSMLRADEDTILDLVQDTFLKAFDSLDQLSDPSSFNAWVKTIAKHKATDWLKKSKPMLFSDLAPEDGEAQELQFEDRDTYNLPDVVMDRKETARLINEILDQLSDRQRAVISMYYYEGLSIEQIAGELGIKPGTVKATLNQARAKIEAKVRELEEKEGIKLYSLSPIAFLLLLFRNWDGGYMAQPNPVILEKLLDQAARSAKMESGTNASGGDAGNGADTDGSTDAGQKGAGRAAASAVKGAAGVSTPVKIAAIVAAVLLGGAAIGGGIYAASRSRAETPETTPPVESTLVSAPAETPEETVQETPPADPLEQAYEAYAQVYSELMAEYGDSHTETFTYYDYDGNPIDEISHAAGIFYANLIDFTGDEIPELLLAYCAGMEDGDQFPSFRVGVWSWTDSELELIYHDFLPYHGGDFADQSLVIAYKDEKAYIVTKEGGDIGILSFLSWNGTDFESTITFLNEYDEAFWVNGQSVTEQEYINERNKWPKNTWPEWSEDFQVYAPYGMGSNYWYVDSYTQMETNAKQAIAETKAALGLGGTTITEINLDLETDSSGQTAESKDSTDRGIGMLGVRANYDPEITPSSDDKFVITYENEDTHEISKMTLNASELTVGFTDFEIPEGFYKITSIKYLGANQEIINQGYGVESSFGFYAGGDDIIHLSIGNDAIDSLEIDDYHAVIMDDEHDENGIRNVFYDEFGNAYSVIEDEEGNTFIEYLEEPIFN